MAIRRSEPPKETMLSREDIEALINVIHEKGIDEFELEQGGVRLRVVAQRPPAQTAFYQPPPMAPTVAMMPYPGMPAPAPQHYAPAPPPAGQQESAATSSTPGKPTAEEFANAKKITSPMVGTFYRASAPGAKPFVEVGDKVDEDSVLCIIEAMKLMNEIKAEMRGTIRKILVENAQPVEYGQALYLIDPA